MKVIIRASVLTLVFAGALASAFTPKSHTVSTAAVNTMVVSSAQPIPFCNPGETCGIPRR